MVLESVLTAYFFHQFMQPRFGEYRAVSEPKYIERTHPRSKLHARAYETANGTIAPGMQRVEMLRVELEADCIGDATVQSIHVQRRGLGANSDIDALYVLHRGRRISTARTVSKRDGTVDLNVRSLVVPACQTEEAIIYADFSESASPASQHSIVLRGIDAGGAPVSTTKAARKRLRSVAGPSRGMVSIEYLRVNERVHYGANQRISRFRLGADSQSDHAISAITFTNNGSASDADLQNIYVDFRGRARSVVAEALDDDQVTLVFDPPVLLQKNQKLQFSVRADVRASRSRTIQFIVEEPSDIVATPVRGRR